MSAFKLIYKKYTMIKVCIFNKSNNLLRYDIVKKLYQFQDISDVLLLVLPHLRRLKTSDDDTKDIHLAIVMHSGIDRPKPVQSFTSSDQHHFGLLRDLIPLTRPCNISVERFSALTTWPKYFNLLPDVLHQNRCSLQGKSTPRETMVWFTS